MNKSQAIYRIYHRSKYVFGARQASQGGDTKMREAGATVVVAVCMSRTHSS